MFNHTDLTAELPEPRDDEPQSLRGDIVDELADHLHCSLRKELLSGVHGNDEKQAWQSVLRRFGNPARIVLECWLIKMKGKLIMQKISLGISMAAVILCATLVALVWKTMETNQQATASMLDTQTKMIDKMEQLVQATLDKQKSDEEGGGFGGGGGGQPIVQPVINTKETQEWIPFKIQLASGSTEGPPIVNQKIVCTGHFAGANEEAVERTTDEKGMVDFGLVRPDSYRVQIEMPWGEQTSSNNNIRVIPSYQTEVVVCPVDPKLKPLTLALDVPEDLRSEPLSYIFNSDNIAERNQSVVNFQKTNHVNHWYWKSTRTKLANYRFDSKGVLSTTIATPKSGYKLNLKPLALNKSTQTIEKCELLHIYYGETLFNQRSWDYLGGWSSEQEGYEMKTNSYLFYPVVATHNSLKFPLPPMSTQPDALTLVNAETGEYKIRLSDDFWTQLRAAMRKQKEIVAEQKKIAEETKRMTEEFQKNAAASAETIKAGAKPLPAPTPAAGGRGRFREE